MKKQGEGKEGDKEKHEENTSISFKNIIVFVVPVILLIAIVMAEIIFLSDLSNRISSNFTLHTSEIKDIVLRYEDYFTPDQVDDTKENIISPQIATGVSAVLNKITSQMWYGLVIIAIAGLAWAVIQGISTPTNFEGNKNVKQKDWIDATTNVSSAVTAAVTVGISIVGAVSFLTPGVVGGYVFVGLQVLFLCVLMGIFVNSLRGMAVVKAIDGGERFEVDRKYGSLWFGFTSMQFAMLLLGIVLLIRQALFF